MLDGRGRLDRFVGGRVVGKLIPQQIVVPRSDFNVNIHARLPAAGPPVAGYLGWTNFSISVSAAMVLSFSRSLIWYKVLPFWYTPSPAWAGSIPTNTPSVTS